MTTTTDQLDELNAVLRDINDAVRNGASDAKRRELRETVDGLLGGRDDDEAFETGLRIGRRQGKREATGEASMDGHEPWCTHHVPDDDEGGAGYCSAHLRVEALGGAVTIDIQLDDDGRLVIDPYVESGSTFTAHTARRIASAFNAASAIVDGAALPGGQGGAFSVDHVAALAQVRPYEVRSAIVEGQLTAHQSVDGAGQLLVEVGEAFRWAKARRESLPCASWDSCPTPEHQH